MNTQQRIRTLLLTWMAVGTADGIGAGLGVPGFLGWGKEIFLLQLFVEGINPWMKRNLQLYL